MLCQSPPQNDDRRNDDEHHDADRSQNRLISPEDSRDQAAQQRAENPGQILKCSDPSEQRSRPSGDVCSDKAAVMIGSIAPMTK